MSEHRGKIVIDLDGVIAGPKTDSYDDCEPNLAMIARLKELKRLGYDIAIHTSRNVRSHDHNLGKLTADTAVSVGNYLNKVGCPYDELWMNKPWVGKTGFYVDDRAVSPKQFLGMELGELLNMARSEAFQYETGGAQGWVIIKAIETAYLDADFIKAVRVNRGNGFRTLVLTTDYLSGGHQQELIRNGCKILDDGSDGINCFGAGTRHLLNEGLASANSPIIAVNLEHDIYNVSVPEIASVEDTLKRSEGEDTSFIGLAAVSTAAEVSRAFGEGRKVFAKARPVSVDWDRGSHVLKSRHFNEVVALGDQVYKTSTDPKQIKKLKFEQEWLSRVPRSVKVRAIPGGYASVLQDYGSLAGVLARSEFDDSLITKFAQGLNALWRGLDLPADADTVPESAYDKEHMDLYVHKSIDRLAELNHLIPGITEKDWIINGKNHGTPQAMVQSILAQLPIQTVDERATFHGDFCPGNIVVGDMYGPRLLVIDPRGTIDGETLALVGDYRYDLGKLSHALRWGYDTILDNWYDCHWTDTETTRGVTLTLWDELEHLERPARLRLWDKLVEIEFGNDGSIDLDDNSIQLIAALQLITCAPLHMDDPKRATALVARGLQAGVQTLERMRST